MALDSTSTITDALSQYNDNLAWDNDRTKALLALEAVRWLLANRAQVMSDGGTRLDWNDLANEKKHLEQFVSLTATSGRSSFTRGKALI